MPLHTHRSKSLKKLNREILRYTLQRHSVGICGRRPSVLLNASCCIQLPEQTIWLIMKCYLAVNGKHDHSHSLETPFGPAFFLMSRYSRWRLYHLTLSEIELRWRSVSKQPSRAGTPYGECINMSLRVFGNSVRKTLSFNSVLISVLMNATSLELSW